MGRGLDNFIITKRSAGKSSKPAQRNNAKATSAAETSQCLVDRKIGLCIVFSLNDSPTDDVQAFTFPLSRGCAVRISTASITHFKANAKNRTVLPRCPTDDPQELLQLAIESVHHVLIDAMARPMQRPQRPVRQKTCSGKSFHTVNHITPRLISGS